MHISLSSLVSFFNLCIDLLWVLIILGMFTLFPFIQFVTSLIFFPKYGETNTGGVVSTIFVHHMSILSLSGLQITPDPVMIIFSIRLGLLLMDMLCILPSVLQSGCLSPPLCLSLVLSLCLMGETAVPPLPNICLMVPSNEFLFVACCVWIGHSNCSNGTAYMNVSSNQPTASSTIPCIQGPLSSHSTATVDPAEKNRRIFANK